MPALQDADQYLRKKVALIRLFAFGALTNTTLMVDRVGSEAEIVARVQLHGYKMLFRNGLADIQPVEGRIMYGALWDVSPTCLTMLKFYEKLYQQMDVVVVHDVLGSISAKAYTLVNKTSQEPPSGAYQRVIKEGYVRFGIPSSQLSDAVRVAQRECQDDVERICREESDYPELWGSDYD